MAQIKLDSSRDDHIFVGCAEANTNVVQTSLTKRLVLYKLHKMGEVTVFDGDWEMVTMVVPGWDSLEVNGFPIDIKSLSKHLNLYRLRVNPTEHCFQEQPGYTGSNVLTDPGIQFNLLTDYWLDWSQYVASVTEPSITRDQLRALKMNTPQKSPFGKTSNKQWDQPTSFAKLAKHQRLPFGKVKVDKRKGVEPGKVLDPQTPFAKLAKDQRLPFGEAKVDKRKGVEPAQVLDPQTPIGKLAEEQWLKFYGATVDKRSSLQNARVWGKFNSNGKFIQHDFYGKPINDEQQKHKPVATKEVGKVKHTYNTSHSNPGAASGSNTSHSISASRSASFSASAGYSNAHSRVGVSGFSSAAASGSSNARSSSAAASGSHNQNNPYRRFAREHGFDI